MAFFLRGRLLIMSGCPTFTRPFPTEDECLMFVAVLDDIESQIAPNVGTEITGDRLAGLIHSYDRKRA